MQANHYQHIDPLVLLKAVAQDQEAFCALSRTFLEITPPMLARLELAVRINDYDAISHETHALKGTTSLVGAIHLTSLIQEIEKLARVQDINLVELIPALISQFNLVTEDVEASIQKNDGSAGMKSSER
tara:strand:+ start:561991 stop:562377 length:387 start_codon:yes stop_codon:yes gene_type:complete